MNTDTEVLMRMNAVVADILDLPDLVLRRELSAKEIEGWDSLAHINIIVGMENEFAVNFSLSDVKGLRNVGDFVDLVLSKLK